MSNQSTFNTTTIAFIIISLIVGAGGGYFYSSTIFQPRIEELEDNATSRSYQISNQTSRITSLENDIDTYENLVIHLESNIDTLIVENMEYQDDISTLNLNNEVLESENSALNLQLTDLVNDVSTLQTQKTSLESSVQYHQSRYSNLRESYDNIVTAYQLENILRIGNSLESYYDSVRDGLGPTGTEYWWRSPTKHIWQIEVDFAATLAEHDLWRRYWPAFETDYEELIGENSYETAWHIIESVLEHIDISSTDSPEEKISKILSFLDDNIHYEVEVNDLFLAPVETLGFKSGDCDDFSILCAALFECVDIESAIGFFKNDNDEYHAMVLVNLDDLKSYGYWYYDDLTDLGLSEGKWIKIEPQSTIDLQGDEEWIHQWNILVAAEIAN